MSDCDSNTEGGPGGQEAVDPRVTVITEQTGGGASGGVTGGNRDGENASFTVKASSEGSDMDTELFNIDYTPPTTTDDYTDDGWEDGPQTVTLTCTDQHSGCNVTEYCVDQSDQCTPDEEGTSVTVSSEGENFVRYNSTDNSGNQEGTDSQRVRINTTSSGSSTTQPRMRTVVDTVEVNLGQEMSSSLVVHNPLDRPDIYDIGVETVMGEGDAYVRIEGDNRTSDRVQVEVGPGETRSVQTVYTGASCSSKTCAGTASFVGVSLETDERFSASTDVVVRRDTEVYGSPGITGVHALVAGLLAAALSIFWS